MKKFLLTHIFLFISFFYLSAQTVPDDWVHPICEATSISSEVPQNTFIFDLVTPCDPFNPLSPYLAFYYIKIFSGTTFTFTVDPVGNDDYDFVAFLNPVWTNLNATPDNNTRGSQNDPTISGQYNLGLSMTATDFCEGGGIAGNPEPGFVRYFDVQPGDEILIAIDRWSETNDGYTISFGGDSVLDCTILGKSYGKCDVDGDGHENFNQTDFMSDLTLDYPGNNYYFYDNQDNAEDEVGPQISFPYVANETDNPTSLFVRIENASGSLVRVIQVLLFVNPIPEIQSPLNLVSCDEDGDGNAIFDLTTSEPDLVPNPNLFDFTYYENLSDAQAGNANTINPATAYTSTTGTIYVRVKSGSMNGNDEGCVSVGQIHLEITDPLTPIFSFPVTYCEGTETNLLPNTSDNDIIGSWDSGNIDTSSVGTTNYTFTPEMDQCAVSIIISITIVSSITPDFSLPLEICQNTLAPDLEETSDNGIHGTWSPSMIDTTTQGSITYTFTPDDPDICSETVEYTINITDQIQPQFTITPTYCEGETPDPLSPTSENGITGDWSSTVIDTTTPGTTDYTFTPDADQCAGTYTISVTVNPELELTSGISEPLCDEDLDGDYETDLTELNTELTTTPGITFNYYASLTDYNNDNPIPQGQVGNYTFTTLPATIYVVGTTAQGCRSEEVAVTFTQGQEVTHSSDTYGPIGFCEGEEIDLTQLEGSINSGADYTYYETEQNAQTGSNPITDPETYTPGSNTSVYILLEQTDRCSAVVELTLDQRAAPSLDDLPEEASLCDGSNMEITVSSDDPTATFEWTDQDGNILTGPTQTFTGPGSYTVIAISAENCESDPRTLTINLPSPPVITSVEYGTNSIIVTASNNGNGPLEYSLDGVLWQQSNEFENLIPGEEYTVYVRSGGCVIKKYQATLLSVPNFISPNGDGYNDIWQIRGIEATPTSTIKIFDRYGKIFVDTNFEGDYIWDGKYVGTAVPTGDYWYILDVPGDGISIPHKFVGHISVRNK